MDIDFDEWFDSLQINPVYVIQTNLDIFSSNDNTKQMKQPEPSKLYKLLKKPTEHNLTKRTTKLLRLIELQLKT